MNRPQNSTGTPKMRVCAGLLCGNRVYERGKEKTHNDERNRGTVTCKQAIGHE